MRSFRSLLLASLAGCGTAPTPSPPPAPSLVLVTLDTTRADRLGVYGYDQAHTPHLDALAASSAVFERAYATVPLTTPAHASMLTGLYPSRHGIHTNGDAVLGDDLTTLTEILSARGYHTGASVAAYVTTRVWGLDQGFDAYHDDVRSRSRRDDRWGKERPADEVVDDAARWLAELPKDGRPFFLWVHVYDPHDPYEPPAAWRDRMAGRPYDAEIAFVDEQLGRLREAVDAATGAAGAAWIVTSDHGEALGEVPGEHTHGNFLFDPTMRIPLVVRPATPLRESRRVAGPTVSGVDVMPTALGLLGLDVPEGLDGADLTPFVRGESATRAPVYLESWTVARRFGWHPEVAVAEGSLKLMDTPSARLFDVVADPGERTDLSAARAADVERLRAVAEQVQAATVQGRSGPVAPEVVDQLAALGYMAVADASDDAFASTVDAKDRIAVIEALERARRVAATPDGAAEAERLLLELLAAEPGIAEARVTLVRVLQAQGRLAEAEAQLREALSREPTSTVLHANLAGLLALKGEIAAARDEYEAVLALVPTDSSARVGVLRMLLREGRHDEAARRGQAWLAEGPDHGLEAMLGLMRMEAGDLEGAVPLLERSLADDVPRAGVHTALARAATAREDHDAARAHLQAALDAFPQDLLAAEALARLEMLTGRWAEAAAEYQRLAEEGHRPVESRRRWAQAIFNAGDYELAAQILAPALEQAPDDPQAVLLQANILKKIGDPIAAEAMARRAFQLRDAREAP